jgi:hypothetical protein
MSGFDETAEFKRNGEHEISKKLKNVCLFADINR